MFHLLPISTSAETDFIAFSFVCTRNGVIFKTLFIGGQKARVSLARAVYSSSDVVLLDAPLAAVDAIVGKSIWDMAVTGELAGRTRVMTTNHVSYAAHPAVDFVAVLSNGGIEFGKPQHLAANPLSQFARIIEAGHLGDGKTSGENGESLDDGGESQVLDGQGRDKDYGSVEAEGSDGIMSRGLRGHRDALIGKGAQFSATAAVSERGRLITREMKSRGRVAWRHYAKYFNAAGGLQVCLGIFVVFTLSQIATIGTTVFLSAWSEESRLRGYSEDANTNESLAIFGAISLAAILFTGVGNIALVFGSLRASVRMHEQLCVGAFGSPMAYFNTTPTGRIINRFNSSIDKVRLN